MELTPIEKHNDIYFKRDDLYVPYEDCKVSGGKVRQCRHLLKEALNKKSENKFIDFEKEEYKGVITYSSVESPQSLIVTRVAKEYNLPTTIVIGGRNITDDHFFINKSKEFGASIVNCSNFGFNNVLASHAKKLAVESKSFLVGFGINAKEYKSIIDAIADQVQNIPDNIDTIIIPVGSAISFSAILTGLSKYNKKIDNIIGIQIANMNREKVVKELYGKDLQYRLLRDDTYPYAKKLELKVDDTLVLDPIYEAKAYEYAVKNKLFTDNTLFWIVGNTLTARTA